MKKEFLIAGISFLLIFFLPLSVSAQTSYVLPYPSAMPGNKMYVFENLWEKVSQFWYYGDFGQFTYNLLYADKYLVEAKTLFEYKQYALAMDALLLSNQYFEKLEGDLLHAEHNGKDISEKLSLLENAKQKHREVLETMKEELPEEIVWIEENKKERVLRIYDLLNESIILRK